MKKIIVIFILVILGITLYSRSLLAPKDALQNTMHPSWDLDGDGVNDCENDGSCDHTIDYTQPKK